MTPKELPSEAEHIAYWVTPKQRDRLILFDDEYIPLLECNDIRCDENGDLHILTYRPISKKHALEEKLIQIAKDDPRGDIFAPYSRCKIFREEVVNDITGGLEGAIHMSENILNNVIHRKALQIQGMGAWASILLAKLGERYDTTTDEEFRKMRRETDVLLKRVHLDPDRLRDTEKRQIAEWELKASLGLDSLGRRNKLIILKALAAARNEAKEQEIGIQETILKFLYIRETSIFAEDFYRKIFQDVLKYLEPQAPGMPSHVIFQYPERPSMKVENFMKVLKRLQSQLEIIQANPYFRAAQEALTNLSLIEGYITYGFVQEVIQDDLFTKASKPITDVLSTTAK